MTQKIVFYLGLIQILVGILCFCFKKKWKMQLCVFSYNVILIIQFLLQKHYTEFLLVIVDTIKTTLFLVFDLKKWKPNLAIIIFFEIVMVACCIFSWENWYSIFLLLSTMILTFAYWQTSVVVIRIATIISSIFLIINYSFTGLYSTIIAEVIAIISVCVSFIVYRKDLLNKDKTLNSGQLDTEQQL